MNTRRIGFTMATCLVLGNMIGSGVFLLPASLARYGVLSLAGWLVSTAGAVCLALVFARLARFDPAAGGPYAYTRRGFGDLAGFLVAWGYWIACWSANAALAVALVGYLDPFFPRLVRTPLLAVLLAVGCVWLLTFANVFGVRVAGRLQVATTFLKLVPLLLVGVAGLFVLEPAHFTLPQADLPSIARGISATAALTLWAFLGLECATIPARSIEDPQRTIPRATLLGTLLASLVYITCTVGVMGVVPPATLAATSAPFAEAARALFGEWAAALVALGAALSCFGALNGWILVTGQISLAVAADGLFPAAFARLSRRDTPALGIVLSSLFTSALLLMNYTRSLVELFTFVILLSTLATLVPYAFSSLAGFLIEQREGPRPGWGAGAKLAASLAFAYSLGAIGGAGTEVVYWGFLLLVAGLPVYVFVLRRRSLA